MRGWGIGILTSRRYITKLIELEDLNSKTGRLWLTMAYMKMGSYVFYCGMELAVRYNLPPLDGELHGEVEEITAETYQAERGSGGCKTGRWNPVIRFQSLTIQSSDNDANSLLLYENAIAFTH